MSDEYLGLKLLLSYEVNTERGTEYQQFVLQQYIPTMQSMGFQVSEAWHTAYGNAPNRLIGFVCRDRDTVDDLLQSDTWQALNERLLEYVSDFSFKLVPYRGIFQL
jgi:hypothetical protein